jgi:hypothetical protein
VPGRRTDSKARRGAWACRPQNWDMKYELKDDWSKKHPPVWQILPFQPCNPIVPFNYQSHSEIMARCVDPRRGARWGPLSH